MRFCHSRLQIRIAGASTTFAQRDNGDDSALNRALAVVPTPTRLCQRVLMLYNEMLLHAGMQCVFSESMLVFSSSESLGGKPMIMIHVDIPIIHVQMQLSIMRLYIYIYYNCRFDGDIQEFGHII